MATPIQFRRGTTTQRLGVTLDAGMPGFDTDLKRLFVGDGVTPGGVDIAPPVVSFKNQLINGDLGIWQRGTSFSAVGYTADRFFCSSVGTTFTTSQLTVAPGAAYTPSRYAALHAITSVAGAGNFFQWVQPIENVRLAAGRTVTVSFTAYAGVAGKKIGVSLDQRFGTGGSPSANVAGVGQSVTLTTGPVRYSLTFVMPSIAGKTLGTAGNDSTNVNWWLDAGATYATQSGTIGQLSTNVVLLDMQVEYGAVATDFEQRPPAVEMALSQRYYERNADVGVALLDATAQTFTSFAFAANTVRMTHTFRVTKRVFPAITYARPGSSGAAAGASATQWAVFSANWAAATVATLTSGTNGFCANLTTTIAGGTSCLVEGNWAADAEL